jgi:hypothetical protein
MVKHEVVSCSVADPCPTHSKIGCSDRRVHAVRPLAVSYDWTRCSANIRLLSGKCGRPAALAGCSSTGQVIGHRSL